VTTKMVQQLQSRSHAHATGAMYLSYFVVAILGMIMVNRKIPGGIVVSGLATLLYATVTILLYRLFRPGQPLLALSAVLCSLAGSVNDVLDQLHHGVANLSSLVFFGPFCMLLGVLILRSRFLPHWLGWPLIVAGLGWLAYLVPTIAQHAKVVIFPIGFLAEFELMLWLLIRGLDEARWPAQRN
jgi:hypothetical protein